jgi:hypothetical protein
MKFLMLDRPNAKGRSFQMKTPASLPGLMTNQPARLKRWPNRRSRWRRDSKGKPMRNSRNNPLDDDLQADVYNPFDDVPDDDVYRDTEDGRCERARAKFTARKLTWMTAFHV